MIKFKPYSKNIIFLDTEFSTGVPNIGELLSIGLVKLNGDELYLELEYDGPIDVWVTENVVPYLTGNKISRTVAVRKIKKFVGKRKPYVIAYVNLFDMTYLHKLLKSKTIQDMPFKWTPIDFSSMLFAIGINPEAYYVGDKENFFKNIGVDTKKFKHNHNALDDAKLLREVYLKMVK